MRSVHPPMFLADLQMIPLEPMKMVNSKISDDHDLRFATDAFDVQMDPLLEGLKEELEFVLGHIKLQGTLVPGV